MSMHIRSKRQSLNKGNNFEEHKEFLTIGLQKLDSEGRLSEISNEGEEDKEAIEMQELKPEEELNESYTLSTIRTEQPLQVNIVRDKE